MRLPAWDAYSHDHDAQLRASPWQDRINWHGFAFFAVVLVLLIAVLTW